MVIGLMSRGNGSLPEDDAIFPILKIGNQEMKRESCPLSHCLITKNRPGGAVGVILLCTSITP